MIHEFIFAYPRPGMTEAEFQRYWVEVHAVRFDSVDAALTVQNSVQQDMVRADYRLFTEERYIHTMLVREHWITGPQPRPYSDQRTVSV